MCTDAACSLTIAKLPGSDLAAIQFLNRSLEELGIIKVEAGAQDGNLFGRLLVKVATYMLKPGPAGPGFAEDVFAGVAAGVVTSGSLILIFFRKLSAVTFDFSHNAGSSTFPPQGVLGAQAGEDASTWGLSRNGVKNITLRVRV